MWLLVSQWDGKLRTDALHPFKGIRIVCLMPTLKQFKDVHAKLLRDELDGEWAFLNGQLNLTNYEIKFPGGSSFTPFPAEIHTSKRARGIRADVVLADEVDDIDRSTWDSVVRPWFSEPWSLKYRIAGGTPRRGRHGLLYELHRLGLSRDPKHERYRSFHATYRDCPDTVDAAEVEDARLNTPPAAFAREWECDFDSAEGLVFPMFSEDVHVRDPPPNVVWREIIVGVDHGWRDPGVFLKFGLAGSGRDTIAWAIDEVYESDREEDWWVDQAVLWNQSDPHATWYADPSMPARIAALARKAKCRMQALEPDERKIEDGVGTVANLMALREREDGSRVTRLFISPKCKNFIRELGLYRHKRDPKSADKFTDTIEGRNDHCPDAARYALHGRLGKTLSQRIDRSATTYQDG